MNDEINTDEKKNMKCGARRNLLSLKIYVCACCAIDKSEIQTQTCARYARQTKKYLIFIQNWLNVVIRNIFVIENNHARVRAHVENGFDALQRFRRQVLYD